jgi:hypothetical protein
MPLRSRPTRARDTPDARSLLEEEVTEETRARPLFDARTFLEIEAQEETGITPKSGTEETEENWGFEQITNEEPVVLDVKTEPGEPQPDIEQLTNGPFVPVVKTEPGEPHSAAVGDEAPAQPAVVNLATQAVIALVGRLADRGLFVHDGAVPTIRELEHTSAKKDRSKGKVVWHNDNLNVDLAQIALFVKVVNPLDGATAKELPWRLGPSNPTINFTLDGTGGTIYDFKYNYSAKFMLREGQPMFDPNRKYSLTNTIDFIRQVDLQTQAQAGTVCSTIVADFKRLHQNKTDVTFNQYVDLARAGDKVHHEGAISTPHKLIIHAFCNPPWVSTPVHAFAVNGYNFVVSLNPVVGRGKDTSPNLAKYNQYQSLFKAAVLKQNLDTPPVSKVTTTGDLQKLTIEETQGWTIAPFEEGQELLIVGHFEPTFAPNYCSPELRLDHVYILPIEPVAFEWPESVTSASTSATTTPNNTPNKKPKIELLTDF